MDFATNLSLAKQNRSLYNPEVTFIFYRVIFPEAVRGVVGVRREEKRIKQEKSPKGSLPGVK
jgi:hypothetical protein